MHTAMMAASDSYRLQHSHVTIDGTVPLDFNRYPYITQVMDEHAPHIDVIKGAQMGFTIACIMRALEDAKRLDLRGIGYMFPTEGEVSDFAKARFGPMMTNNQEVWGNEVEEQRAARRANSSRSLSTISISMSGTKWMTIVSMPLSIDSTDR